MTGESLFICCLGGGGKVSHDIDWTWAAGRKERPSLRLGGSRVPRLVISALSSESAMILFSELVPSPDPLRLMTASCLQDESVPSLKECRDCEKGRVAVDAAALEIKIQFVILSPINIILLILSTQC